MQESALIQRAAYSCIDILHTIQLWLATLRYVHTSIVCIDWVEWQACNVRIHVHCNQANVTLLIGLPLRLNLTNVNTKWKDWPQRNINKHDWIALGHSEGWQVSRGGQRVTSCKFCHQVTSLHVFRVAGYNMPLSHYVVVSQLLALHKVSNMLLQRVDWTLHLNLQV